MQVTCRICRTSLTHHLQPAHKDDLRPVGVDRNGRLTYQSGFARLDAGLLARATDGEAAGRLRTSEPARITVVNPCDATNMRWSASSTFGCCGEDARNGPNVECTGCAALVGVLVSDCHTGTALYFDPTATQTT